MASAARVETLAAGITTGNIARVALGQSLSDLSTAYITVQNYGSTHADALAALGNPVAALSSPGGSAGAAAEQGQEYLDGIRTRAQSDFDTLQATDDPLDPSAARQIAFDIASIETASGIINSTLNTSPLQDLADDITNAARSILPDPAKLLLGAIPWWAYAIGIVVVALVVWRWWRE
jgi:hypothetical protein